MTRSDRLLLQFQRDNVIKSGSDSNQSSDYGKILKDLHKESEPITRVFALGRIKYALD